MSTVELIYPTHKQQEIFNVDIKADETIEDVINKSGILEKHPEIDLSVNKVGIYNQVKKLNEIVKAKDRIEIYRVLIADPKEVRRKRAEKQKLEGIIK